MYTSCPSSAGFDHLWLKLAKSGPTRANSHRHRANLAAIWKIKPTLAGRHMDSNVYSIVLGTNTSETFEPLKHIKHMKLLL